MYLAPGFTFTSRGCNNRCPYCLVKPREGSLRLLDPIPPGHVIGDNNFLQCPKKHRQKVYAMLAQQSRAADFRGGLEANLVTDEVAEEFRRIRVARVFLACDSIADIEPLRVAANRLSFLGRNKLFCYVLLAFAGETIPQAEARLKAVWEAGCLPFAQLFQPPQKRIKYRHYSSAAYFFTARASSFLRRAGVSNRPVLSSHSRRCSRIITSLPVSVLVTGRP
jgi:hypothetical protein